MKNKHKIIGFLLAVLMLFLCACDGNSGGTTFNVTFNYNYTGAPASTIVDVKDGKTVSKPATNPTRDEYTFTGWYTNSACTTEFDFNTKITDDTIIFAGWSADNFIVTFNLNYTGSTSTTQKVDKGSVATRPNPNPARDGYAFDDWYTTTSGNTKFDFSTAINSATTVYAKWNVSAVLLTFDLNYNGSVNITERVTIGEAATAPIPAPTRDRYGFVGWYTDIDGTQAYNFSTLITEAKTLYAKWSMTVAQVTFNYNYNGSTNTTQDVNINDTAIQPSAPLRTEYNFVEWCTDIDGTTAFNFAAAITTDITLYAKWQIKTYAIYFDLNFTGDTDFSVSVSHGSPVTRPSPNPDRGGYVFTGWYTDAAATSAQYNFSTAVTGAFTLYADWETDTGALLTVNFKNNYSQQDTSNFYSAQITVGSQMPMPSSTPTRAGYLFKDWYTTSALTTVYDAQSAATASVDIYARWLKQNIFEAEYTYLAGKLGMGLSANGEGPEMLLCDARTMENSNIFKASNNYFVYQMYYNGAYLEFEIYAASAITDAVLEIRLTPEYWDMFFADTEYQVEVNKTRIEYGFMALTIDGYTWPGDEGWNKIGSPEFNRRPFENFSVTTSLNLKAGNNSIKLITNNDRDKGGTYSADTPSVDCIYIYTDTAIDWAEGKKYESNLNHFNKP